MAGASCEAASCEDPNSGSMSTAGPESSSAAEIRSGGREQRFAAGGRSRTQSHPRALAAGGKYPHPRRAGNSPPLGEQAGLADAGASLDDGEPPSAAPRRVGQYLQRRDLDFALQQQDGGPARSKNTRRLSPPLSNRRGAVGARGVDSASVIGAALGTLSVIPPPEIGEGCGQIDGCETPRCPPPLLWRPPPTG